MAFHPDHSAKVVLETGSYAVWTVAFHPDGKHVFGGMEDEIRRWRIADGQEVGKQTGKDHVNTIAVSRDHKWVAFGTWEGASVWDAELREKVVAVEVIMEDTQNVRTVDVAPDCSRFATGTNQGQVTIWSITTGERLVGPLQHGGCVSGIRFSPDGGRIATACDSTIRIFDSHNGDQLVSIENPMPGNFPTTPIVWSADGQHLFAVSTDNKLKSFDSSTRTQLAEWRIHENDEESERMSIALSPNNKVIASCAGRFISFWDTSTHAQLGIVEETHAIQSIALSPNGSCLASGSYASGRISIWDLHGILPASYLPIHVSTTFLRSGITFIHLCFHIDGAKSLLNLNPECKESLLPVIDSSLNAPVNILDTRCKPRTATGSSPPSKRRAIAK